MYTRIIVPLDGSELAESALTHALSLAKLSGAPLHLVRVVDLGQLERYGAYGMAVDYAGLAQVAADDEAQSKEYLAGVVARLGKDGVTADSELLRGGVVASLNAIAKPDDLLVIASHGRTGVTRWFLGSVAEELVRKAPCPVLVVRAEPRPDAAPAS